jgi:predicted RND superfamily exporter protein
MKKTVSTLFVALLIAGASSVKAQSKTTTTNQSKFKTEKVTMKADKKKVQKKAALKANSKDNVVTPNTTKVKATPKAVKAKRVPAKFVNHKKVEQINTKK